MLSLTLINAIFIKVTNEKVKKMTYKPLKITFYENKNNFEDEYQNRFNQFSSFKTGLFIHPFDRGKRITSEKYELFYVSMLDHELSKETIQKNSKKIRGHMRSLPDLVNDKLFLSQIVEEIQSTNDIEGVQSTRKEIGEAVENRNNKVNIRFKGIVNMYLNLGDKNYQTIKEITRIREIYDELFSEDIPQEEQPDGKLFRNEVVYIGNETKYVHQGNPNEETIIRDLDLLVSFMNRKDVPDLLKCVVSHYFFEYIHPFYDGNGRMGRFLMSNYLSRKLDRLTGITISNSVLHSKKKYEKSFSEVSNPRNRADLTLFVQSMYELIIDGQEKIIADLEEAQAKMNNAVKYLESTSLSSDEKKAIFILCQNHMFDVIEESVKDKEVREFLNWSYPKTKKIFESLEDKGYVEKVSKNPVMHKLAENVVKEID